MLLSSSCRHVCGPACELCASTVSVLLPTPLSAEEESRKVFMSSAEREHVSLLRRHAHAAGSLAQAVADAASPLAMSQSLQVGRRTAADCWVQCGRSSNPVGLPAMYALAACLGCNPQTKVSSSHSAAADCSAILWRCGGGLALLGGCL